LVLAKQAMAQKVLPQAQDGKRYTVIEHSADHKNS